jgi:hypothetical protein
LVRLTGARRERADVLAHLSRLDLEVATPLGHASGELLEEATDLRDALLESPPLGTDLTIHVLGLGRRDDELEDLCAVSPEDRAWELGSRHVG